MSAQHMPVGANRLVRAALNCLLLTAALAAGFIIAQPAVGTPDRERASYGQPVGAYAMMRPLPQVGGAASSSAVVTPAALFAAESAALAPVQWLTFVPLTERATP